MRGDGSGYKPISDYAAIGNLRSIALIAKDGSLDWLCFPELSSDAVFAALLDRTRGGSFRLAPVQRSDTPHLVKQRYIRDTNVLETVFETDRGRLVVTDFMPIWGNLNGVGRSTTRPEVVRMLRARGGPVDVSCHWAPRPGFAVKPPRFRRSNGGIIAEGPKGERVVLGGLPVEGQIIDDGFGPALSATFTLRPGEPTVLVTRWNSDDSEVDSNGALDDLARTTAIWRDWVHKHEATGTREWAAPYSKQIIRSELALKLLIHGDTGAIAAAATTSLPEEIGGVRNWDYRYTWIRDASLTVQALSALGHSYAALDFLKFAHQALEREEAEYSRLRIMYGLHGEARLPEIELEHLEGYRGSKPVRVGNEAAIQVQHDVHGELLSAAYELIRLGIPLPERLWLFLSRVADHAAECWKYPDAGIWEMRSPRQFIHSKGMVWVALDRAAHMAMRFGLPGGEMRWRRIAKQVRDYTIEKGFDPNLGAFVQAVGVPAVDAANLRLVLHEFLPPTDPRVQATVDRTMQDLLVNGLLYRYRNDDGFPGSEGAFGITTCWLIGVLALSGRLDEAFALFEGLIGRSNHVDLFSEQIEPNTGEFLGNFPQAFTHLGIINAALYLAYCTGRELPFPAPVGTDSHRIEADHADSSVHW